MVNDSFKFRDGTAVSFCEKLLINVPTIWFAKYGPKET